MKKMVLFLILATGLSCVAYAQKKGGPPQAVLAAFQQKFTGAQDVDWEREKNGSWEAEFEQNGEESSASFSSAGQWLETETEIKFADLPAAVRSAVQGKKVKESARILRSDGSTVFEVEIRRKDLHYDPMGKLVAEEGDDDDD